MSSIPALSSIIESLTSMTSYRPQATTPGDTTLTANAARDAATVPFAAVTNFAANDPIAIIGDGGTELNSYVSTATLVVTLGRKLVLAQTSGARVLEMEALALGDIAEDSVRFTGASSSTPIPAATSRTPIGYLSNPGELGFAFGLLSYDYRSLALAFGMNELETGAGSASDPYQFSIGRDDVAAHGLLCFRGRGVRTDGKIVEVDFLDCTIDVSADVNISGKTVRPINVAGKCTGVISRIWAA